MPVGQKTCAGYNFCRIHKSDYLAYPLKTWIEYGIWKNRIGNWVTRIV